MTSLRVERVYPHPRERVWRALTDAELLGRWLMPCDFEPVVGHRFTFRTEPGPGFDGIVHCQVTAIDEPAMLAFTWAGGPIDTVVTFTLEEVERGTRLVMEQRGFQGVKAWLVSRILKAGNRTIYGRRLPALLAEIASGAGDAAAATSPDEQCMTRGQGVVRRILDRMERKRR